jgi:DNA replication protein DnaC
MTPEIAGERLTDLALAFKLPTVAAELVHRLQQAEHDDALPVLLEVFEQERDDRRQRRVDRLRRASKLPPGKTFDSFEHQRLSPALARKLRELARGDFLEHAVNVLAFGLPGTGKTHSACALGHALVEEGHSVLFTPTYKLVQQLLAAKRDLELPRALKRLDTYELIILDDIGYVQQDADQIEVLFTLMAERYERRSMLITSNLVFSQWDRIFRDPMTTAAAIDRLVHHSVILEFDVESYRTKKTKTSRSPERLPEETDTKANRASDGPQLGERTGKNNCR